MQVNAASGAEQARPEGAIGGGGNDAAIRGLEREIEKERREIEKQNEELRQAVSKRDNNKAQLLRAKIQQRQLSLQTLQSEMETLSGQEEKAAEGGAPAPQARHPFDRVDLDGRALANQRLEGGGTLVPEEMLD